MRIPSITPSVIAPITGAGAVDVRPLNPTTRGTLTLARPDAAGRSFMSATSGIAAAGSAAWAVSDEYGELVRFDRLSAAGELRTGLPPLKNRPDLEAIVHVPVAPGTSGMMFAVGSGSKNDRNRGVVQDVDAAGRAVGAPRTIDLAPLYAELDRRLPLQPNIEGLALRNTAAGPELLVLHRGKMATDVNMIFRLDAALAVDALRRGSALPVDALRGQVQVDLGSLGGARLGFADATALPDGRVAFIASSEGNDATNDGVIYGSVVGMLDSDLRVTTLRPLTGLARKVEGIELATRLEKAASPSSFVLVTDPDDPAKPTELLSVDLA